jgi:RNA polymerase sigma-70 factor (ECF subfamily)
MAAVDTSRAIAVRNEQDAIPACDFEALIESYRPRVFRFALASLRDRDLAETVTQDCLLKAHRGWREFRGDANVQTWLMQIAVNLIRDVTRSRRLSFWKRAQNVAVPLDDASGWVRDQGPSPEALAAARQQVAAIWKVVEGLSDRQRTVFLLHFMEGMRPAEIEAVTGISRAAIKVHLYRAIHTIREILGESQ